MRVFITGICGFIGTNLALHLNHQGFDVAGMDLCLPAQNFKRLKKEKIEVHVGDVTIERDLQKHVAEGTDAIVHLAAETEARTPYSSSGVMMQTNLMGTHNVAKVSVELGVRKLLFASSGAVYGLEDNKCHPYFSYCKPVNIYGLTKLTGERLIALATSEDDSYNVYNLRISNVYGPWSANKGSVVAVAMRQAKKGDPFVVHGNGEQRRDFIYVKDLCEAVECCLTDVLRPGTYNFAAGESISINRLLRELRGVVDLPEPVYDPAADYGVHSVSYETIGLRQGGVPPNRTLKDGLEETWLWAKTHLDMSS